MIYIVICPMSVSLRWGVYPRVRGVVLGLVVKPVRVCIRYRLDKKKHPSVYTPYTRYV